MRKFIDKYPILAGSVILVSLVLAIFAVTAGIVVVANIFLAKKLILSSAVCSPARKVRPGFPATRCFWPGMTRKR